MIFLEIIALFSINEKRLNYQFPYNILLYIGSKMAIKLNLNSQEITNYKFRNVPRGYDALEVDRYLDQIIQDYLKVEKNNLVSGEELQKANDKIGELEQKIKNLELENQRLKTKVTAMTSKNPNVNSDNVKILKRIDALERYLYKKGINPNDIK